MDMPLNRFGEFCSADGLIFEDRIPWEATLFLLSLSANNGT
jgi:hypothetical protein